MEIIATKPCAVAKVTYLPDAIKANSTGIGPSYSG